MAKTEKSDNSKHLPAKLVQLANVNPIDVSDLGNFVDAFNRPARYLQLFCAETHPVDVLQHFWILDKWLSKSPEIPEVAVLIKKSRTDKDEIKIWVVGNHGSDRPGVNAAIAAGLNEIGLSTGDSFHAACKPPKHFVVSTHVDLAQIVEKVGSLEGLAEKLRAVLPEQFKRHDLPLNLTEVVQQRQINKLINLCRGGDDQTFAIKCRLGSVHVDDSKHGQPERRMMDRGARMPHTRPVPVSRKSADAVNPSLTGVELEDALDVALFKGLDDDTRARIFLVVAKSPEPVNVKFVCEHFAVGKPTVSRHLAILHETRWLLRERFQNQVLYRLNPAAVEQIDQFCAALRIMSVTTRQRST